MHVRSAGHVIVAVALLAMATVLGVLAIVVSGGIWLIVLAIACIVGVVALERSGGRRAPGPVVPVAPGAPRERVEVIPQAESDESIERAGEPLLFLVLLVLLAVGAYVILRLILGPEAGHGQEATRPPGAGSGSTNSAPASTPPGLGGPGGSGRSGGSGSSGYVTASAGVHLRAAPSTASAILATMPAFATPVGLSCYEEGQPVATEPYWYRASFRGVEGYVSGLWLDTGADPARTGLPHC